MKKYLLTLTLSLLLATSTACSGGDKLNGKTPDEVGLAFLKAEVKRDDATRFELLAADKQKEYDDVLDQNYKGNKDKTVTHYQLAEWEFDEETFVYELQYVDPEDKHLKTEYTKVIKTDDGWKVEDIQIRASDIEPYRANKEMNIVKEMGNHE